MRSYSVFRSVPKRWHLFRYIFVSAMALLVIILASQTAVSQEPLLVSENSWIRVQNVGDDPAMLEEEVRVIAEEEDAELITAIDALIKDKISNGLLDLTFPTMQDIFE